MKNNEYEIMQWSDGTWCYRFDLEEYLTTMSDDYKVLLVGTDKWREVVENEE